MAVVVTVVVGWQLSRWLAERRCHWSARTWLSLMQCSGLFARGVRRDKRIVGVALV